MNENKFIFNIFQLLPHNAHNAVVLQCKIPRRRSERERERERVSDQNNGSKRRNLEAVPIAELFKALNSIFNVR